jgi:hypothetical protein
MTLWSFGDPKKSWESLLSKEKMPADNDGKLPFEQRHHHFVRVVRRQEGPNCTGEDGLLAVIVCDSARMALDTESGMIDIPPIR